MPIYEYQCAGGHHHEVIRAYARRDEPWSCLTCGLVMQRLEVSASHVPPDGVYSYAPNTGDPERFELRRHAIKNGIKVQERGTTTMERAEIARRQEQAHDRQRRRGRA
jgi:hypothetical protein